MSDLPVAHAVPVFQATSPTAPSQPPKTSFNTEPPPSLASLHPELPPGLLSLLTTSASKFPKRYWILDNSGSMSTPDGHALVGSASVSCTRWNEIAQTVSWQSQTAAALGTPVEFRLVNDPGTGRVFRTDRDGVEGVRRAMDTNPTGRTPLCQRIREVESEIRSDLDSIVLGGGRVIVVVASDGAATDGDAGSALSGLRDLPVWVVVRLCTDDDEVVGYWNRVDADVEIDMDVLDDLWGEAEEVGKLNPWLTYSPEIHRLREWGTDEKVFDLLDERALTDFEIMRLAVAIFGDGAGVEHPDVDYDRFLDSIDRAQRGLKQVYDPLGKRMKPYIDTRKLRKGGCVVM